MTSAASFAGLREWLAPVDQAAAEGIEALRVQAYLHVPGALSRAALRLARLLPARLVTGRTGAAYRRSLQLETARGAGRREV